MKIDVEGLVDRLTNVHRVELCAGQMLKLALSINVSGALAAHELILVLDVLQPDKQDGMTADELMSRTRVIVLQFDPSGKLKDAGTYDAIDYLDAEVVGNVDLSAWPESFLEWDHKSPQALIGAVEKSASALRAARRTTRRGRQNEDEG